MVLYNIITLVLLYHQQKHNLKSSKATGMIMYSRVLKYSISILFAILVTGCNNIPSKSQFFEYNQSLQKEEVEMRRILQPIKTLFSNNDLLIIGDKNGDEFDVLNYSVSNYKNRAGTKSLNISNRLTPYCNTIQLLCTEAVVEYRSNYRIRTLSIHKLNNLTFLKSKNKAEFDRYKSGNPYPNLAYFEGGRIYNTHLAWTELKTKFVLLSELSTQINSKFEFKRAHLSAIYPQLIKFIPTAIEFSSKEFDASEDGFNQLYNFIENSANTFIDSKVTIDEMRKKQHEHYEKQLVDIEYKTRQEAREKQAEIKYSKYKSYMEVHKQVWSGRFNNKYELGDSVCSYKNNLQGNVELVNNNKMKVFWSRRYIGNDGLFFGVFPSYNFTDDYKFKYKYEDLNTYEWINKDQVSSCTITKN